MQRLVFAGTQHPNLTKTQRDTLFLSTLFLWMFFCWLLEGISSFLWLHWTHNGSSCTKKGLFVISSLGFKLSICYKVPVLWEQKVSPLTICIWKKLMLIWMWPNKCSTRAMDHHGHISAVATLPLFMNGILSKGDSSDSYSWAVITLMQEAARSLAAASYWQPATGAVLWSWSTAGPLPANSPLMPVLHLQLGQLVLGPHYWWQGQWLLRLSTEYSSYSVFGLVRGKLHFQAMSRSAVACNFASQERRSRGGGSDYLNPKSHVLREKRQDP